MIKVPLKNPEKAAIVARPRIFADPTTGAIAGLWPGGDHGPSTQRTSTTNQCHDITVMPEAGLAAGACSGNGILMDISNPEQPVRLDHVADKNFAYWHSATFNNDGTKVIFTDEWGGGTRPRCRASDALNWGADAIFDIVDKKLVFKSYYKMPAAQTDTENCVAHNGSLVPVPGRDIMVQGWYQGGVSVFDFTDSANPVEIAYFDRGPIDAKNLITGGYWSAYWYNGNIYGAEIARGIDVFRLQPSEYPERERARRRQPGPLRGVQQAAAAEGHLAAELRRRQGVSRSDDAGQDHRRGAGHGPARRRSTAATRGPAAPPRRSTSSTRWRRSSRPTPRRPGPRTRRA